MNQNHQDRLKQMLSQPQQDAMQRVKEHLQGQIPVVPVPNTENIPATFAAEPKPAEQDSL